MRSLFRHHRVRVYALILPSTLLMNACDNPAPGEGMPKPLAKGPMPEVVSANEALRSPDLTAVDPGTLNQAEVEKVLPSGPRCSYSYTEDSPPILVAVPLMETPQAKGLVKLHSRLVEVRAQSVTGVESLAQGATFRTEGLSITIEPEGDAFAERTSANMKFQLDQGLLVGYRGWYDCSTSH